MTRLFAQCLSGAVLAAIGLAAMAGRLAPLGDYTYPIVWWGLLTLLDAVNQRLRGFSLARPSAARLFGVVMPASVLFWLLFELLNLSSPQWRYAGGIHSLPGQVLFGFLSFATVLPIVVEFWVLIAGPLRLPEALGRFFTIHRRHCLALAAILLVIPLLNHVFWWNQGMWLVPALLLLPFWPPNGSGSSRWFFTGLVSTGLAAGLCWESLNWPSRTHWEYLILPRIPHLFQMPLPGYLGFIPFSLSALAAFQAQKRIPARPLPIALLYALAIMLQTLMTILYRHAGLWRPLAQ